MKDVDIREGYNVISDAITDAANNGNSWTIWNSDEDADDAPAPRAVMISPRRYEELLEVEWTYKELCD